MNAYSVTGTVIQILCVHDLVTVNGPSFVLADTDSFLQNNILWYVTRDPCHPSANGIAEPVLYELKISFTRVSSISLECRLAR